jgi:hypothetical protein
VSVEAISWALHLALAPVPAGRGGQPSTACKFVLAGLADHAEPDACTRASSPSHRRTGSPSLKSLILRAAMNRA